MGWHGEGENTAAIGHDNVLALAGDTESRLLERPDGITVIDARESGQLDRHVDLADLGVTKLLFNDG